MGRVNEASRPVAVRVIRPYLSEDEYLAKEGDSITKTTIELIGAHSRPTGVILRFEVTLQSGKTLIRGEGRVTQFHERSREEQPSLSLRFTKLDAKSKALVDRAVAMRQPGVPTGGSLAPSPSSPELHPLVAPAAPSSADQQHTDDTAPTPPPPAPFAGTNEGPHDTAPPPTPIVSKEQAVARFAAAGDRDAEDLDPDGDAQTNPPPDVVSSSLHQGTRESNRAPGTVPPPTTRPSVLPQAVRAELRRMSDMPPPLPSALPAYDPAEAPAVLAQDPADQAAEEVVSSAANPATNPGTNLGTNGANASVPSRKREALLARLRERASALPPDRLAEITKPRPRGVA